MNEPLYSYLEPTPTASYLKTLSTLAVRCLEGMAKRRREVK